MEISHPGTLWIRGVEDRTIPCYPTTNLQQSIKHCHACRLCLPRYYLHIRCVFPAILLPSSSRIFSDLVRSVVSSNGRCSRDYDRRGKLLYVWEWTLPGLDMARYYLYDSRVLVVHRFLTLSKHCTYGDLSDGQFYRDWSPVSSSFAGIINPSQSEGYCNRDCYFRVHENASSWN